MLISALCDLDLITNEDITSLSFSVSSAFPFYDDYLFFPVPVDFPVNIPSTRAIADEQWFISTDVLSSYFDNTITNIAMYHSGNFIAEESHPVHILYPLWETMYSRHDSRPYAMRFKDKAGLYFLVKTKTKKDKSLLDTAIRFLGDEGIGTGRSVGFGSFKTTEFSSEIPSISPEKRILLSLCCPEKEILSKNLQGAKISWIRRGKTPYLSSDREAKYCYMMREGSVFSLEQPVMKGSTIRFFNANKRFSIDTPIYRFGKPFFME
jgi:CRISPR type III-A-associated RAMP protein Csm4